MCNVEVKIIEKTERIICLPLTISELVYVGNAIGQYDIEFSSAPDSLVEKMAEAADLANFDIETLGWA